MKTAAVFALSCCLFYGLPAKGGTSPGFYITTTKTPLTGYSYGPNNYNPNPPADAPAPAAAPGAATIRDPWRAFAGQKTAATGPGWYQFAGRVLEVQRGGILMWGSYYNASESFTGEFFVTNFPYGIADNDPLSVGDGWTARFAGSYGYNREIFGPLTVRMLDYGQVWDDAMAVPPAPLTPEQIAAVRAAAEKKKQTLAAAALKFNQDQAAAGNPSGQFRMGQRYLAGDGVQTNLAAAREMFTAAARQGHSGAAAALAQLDPAPAPDQATAAAAPEKNTQSAPR